jgi:hypothetical protein
MKGRKHRETGGTNEAKEDLDSKPERRDNATKIENEASERKAGGRTARKHGGEVHKSGCKCEKCMGGKVEAKKEGGKVEGEHESSRADRKPRKSGGSATSNPFSSAHAGSPPAGHKVQAGMG